MRSTRTRKCIRQSDRCGAGCESAPVEMVALVTEAAADASEQLFARDGPDFPALLQLSFAREITCDSLFQLAHSFPISPLISCKRIKGDSLGTKQVSRCLLAASSP